MYLNKVMLIGNLTRDPEVRALPSGIQVASFGLATNRVYKDKNGQKQEAAEFHNIVVFGRQAENVAQYIHKGDALYVEGRLQTRSWEQEGQKKYRTEIVAERVQFGSKGMGRPAGAPGEEPRQSGNQKEDEIDYPVEDINPEDIPF